MAIYKLLHPIEVRYADLDPQGHVNNACYLTYLEQARVAYIRKLGLWDGRSFLNIGLILAEARLTFRAPILFGQPVHAGARVIRLGQKSFDIDYRIENAETGQVFATGFTVMVTYDYRQEQTILIPPLWRKTIAQFEGLPENAAS
ncbi:MAG TPA: acyl-CoA thioesterase [Anaerolineales bacterium]|nr:acyl-CoA thioesterase [Anaerolineales bacterium]